MTDSGGKRDVKSLVSAILKQPQATAEAPTVVASESAVLNTAADETLLSNSTEPSDADREAAELIQVYFQLSEPAERDALVERLCVNESQLVVEFFLAMMADDQDEFLRASAAAELARRGISAGTQALVADLADPEELYFFEHAITVLSEVQGESFYEPLQALWLDERRDIDQRRLAMSGLELISTERALSDFIVFINQQTNIDDLPIELIEVALLAFVRHDFQSAVPALHELAGKIKNSDIEAAERRELQAFVQEGLQLLQTP